MKYEILLADDDASIRLVLSKALTRAGHTVKATDNAETLLKWSATGHGDIILTDVMMNGTEIFNYLPLIIENRPTIPIIIISANNTVNTALKAGRHEVFEYIPKPFDLVEVTQAISRAGLTVNPKKKKINDELSRLPMIGRSPAMQPVYRAISRFSAGNLPILIQGEVGTGKDLVAKLLHDGGARKNLPFFRETDFENTSLTLQKVNGGDIYIDEVAELSFKQQEKLLAVLTASEMNPPTSRPRLISSTRKDLRKLASEGKFRDDLLYRINVAEIRIPPLSERGRDIYELSASFLTRASSNKSRRFNSQALDVLHRHNWSGNVRELENLVNRLSVLYSDDLITAEMVLQEFSKDAESSNKVEQDQKLRGLLETACRRLLSIDPNSINGSSYNIALGWVEKPLIIEALRLTGGNKAKAADYLGIHRNTLRSRLKVLDIS
ncbi:MAG: sigma-54 dependent transcriptional regulator [Hellea sp.]|nr:sigma-54 dependent transcriptional regulator [Hellea sp.]